MESSSRNIRLSRRVELMLFYVLKSRLESKLLSEQLSEGELCRSSPRDTLGEERRKSWRGMGK